VTITFGDGEIFTFTDEHVYDLFGVSNVDVDFKYNDNLSLFVENNKTVSTDEAVHDIVYNLRSKITSKGSLELCKLAEKYFKRSMPVTYKLLTGVGTVVPAYISIKRLETMAGLKLPSNNAKILEAIMSPTAAIQDNPALAKFVKEVLLESLDGTFKGIILN